MVETVGTGIARSKAKQSLRLYKFSSSARVHNAQDTPDDEDALWNDTNLKCMLYAYTHGNTSYISWFFFQAYLVFLLFFPSPRGIFVKYWLMKQTDLAEKNQGFLGIFSIPLLRTCYRRNWTDVPEEAQKKHKNNRAETGGKGKHRKGSFVSSSWVQTLFVCIYVLRTRDGGCREEVKGPSSGMRRRRDECSYLLSWKPTHLLLGCIPGINRFN